MLFGLTALSELTKIKFLTFLTIENSSTDLVPNILFFTIEYGFNSPKPTCLYAAA